MTNTIERTQMVATAVKIESLNAFYGKSQIIHDLSLSLPAGTVSVIVGRNGMGKTTLVKSIMGISGVRRSGSIRLDDEELMGKPSHEIARLGVGYVPQGRRLFASLSVEEHLLLVANIRSSDRGKLWTLDTVYELFPELKERRKIGGTRLSGGEQQMLAVSRALLLNPKVLIMDEPSEGLSKMVIKRVEETCRRVADLGVTVLLVEQNLDMALNMADNAFVLVNGEVTYAEDGDQFRSDRAKIASSLGV